LFFKIFEKVIYYRLNAYFETIGIPSSHQYGFRKKSSTYMAIADVMNEITNFTEEKAASIGVY